jgi:hypothetical protein
MSFSCSYCHGEPTTNFPDTSTNTVYHMRITRVPRESDRGSDSQAALISPVQ